MQFLTIATKDGVDQCLINEVEAARLLSNIQSANQQFVVKFVPFPPEELNIHPHDQSELEVYEKPEFSTGVLIVTKAWLSSAKLIPAVGVYARRMRYPNIPEISANAVPNPEATLSSDPTSICEDVTVVPDVKKKDASE